MNQMPLGDFAPELDPAKSQYHTPQKLARRMVEWAGVGPCDHVLEPSAGGGNIVREVLRAGVKRVTAVEFDWDWSGLLQKEFPTIAVACVDFLSLQSGIGSITLAIANPPLDGGVGGHHVRHALRFAPRVVSVLRGQDLHGQERYRELWSNCDLAGLALLVRRPIFSGEGGRIEVVVVDVRRRGTYHEPPRIEHWPDDWA